MAETDLLRRLLEAGAAFTDMTRTRAESIVEEFVRAGEVGVDQTQTNVQDLIDRSKQNTERLIALVRSEIASQFGVATDRDLGPIEERLSAVEQAVAELRAAVAARPARAATTRKTSARKATAKKSTTAKKATARKTTANKSIAKTSTAKKATAKKSAGT